MDDQTQTEINQVDGDTFEIKTTVPETVITTTVDRAGLAIEIRDLETTIANILSNTGLESLQRDLATKQALFDQLV